MSCVGCCVRRSLQTMYLSELAGRLDSGLVMQIVPKIWYRTHTRLAVNCCDMSKNLHTKLPPRYIKVIIWTPWYSFLHLPRLRHVNMVMISHKIKRRANCSWCISRPVKSKPWIHWMNIHVNISISIALTPSATTKSTPRSRVYCRTIEPNSRILASL